jgi:hypothetical protein
MTARSFGEEFKESFKPDPNRLSSKMVVFFHLYPYLLLTTAGTFFVRFSLYMLHVYSPQITWVPQHSRAVGFIVCLVYLILPVGLVLLKRWLLQRTPPEAAEGDEPHAAAWDEYQAHCDNPPPPKDDERWGGAASADWYTIAGVVFFLAFTGFFTLRALMRTWYP